MVPRKPTGVTMWVFITVFGSPVNVQTRATVNAVWIGFILIERTDSYVTEDRLLALKPFGVELSCCTNM